MKKITFFICSLSSGGAEHQLTELSWLLAERGYDITIVTFGDTPDHYSVHPQIKRVELGANKGTLGKYLAIQSYFLSVKTDCVISFGARESFLCLPTLFLRPGIKVVAGERCLYGDSKRTYLKVNLNLLLKRANYIVPNSYSQKEELIGLKPSLKDKIRVITNYTDLNLYKVTPLPKNKIVRIGVFARYASEKNCIRFAEAVKKFKDEYGSIFHIDWYGSVMSNGAETPYYKNLKKKVVELGIDDVLQLNDAVKDVAARIPNFDLMCLPSLKEGFSNTISEYICCGRPAVVSDVADNGVMVKDGLNGFLFDPTDVDDIANAFRRYFALSDEQRETMAAESRKRAEELFDKELFAKKYIDIIEER